MQKINPNSPKLRSVSFKHPVPEKKCSFKYKKLSYKASSANLCSCYKVMHTPGDSTGKHLVEIDFTFRTSCTVLQLAVLLSPSACFCTQLYMGNSIGFLKFQVVCFFCCLGGSLLKPNQWSYQYINIMKAEESINKLLSVQKINKLFYVHLNVYM